MDQLINFKSYAYRLISFVVIAGEINKIINLSYRDLVEALKSYFLSFYISCSFVDSFSNYWCH